MLSFAALKSLRVLEFDYAYLDSGVPQSSDYTTWVFIHGMVCNAAVLEKLLPLAPAHNLRIVSVYRRGYPPSSGFDDAELAGIGLGKKFDEAEPFLRAQATEIATFLANFATEERIPAADPNNPSGGGIALIGWSLGAILVSTLLAFLDTFPEDTQATLQRYLHTILCHDAGSITFGILNLPRLDLSLWSETDERRLFDEFLNLVTAHFIHKSITSGNDDDLEFNVPSPDIPRSMGTLSYAQRAEYTNIEGVSPTFCDRKLLSTDFSVFAELARRALFDRDRAAKSPQVKMRLMCGGTSGGMFIWAVWMMQKYLENPPEALYGKGAAKARDVKCMIQTEGNHFVFWDDPEKAIQHYGAVIDL